MRYVWNRIVLRDGFIEGAKKAMCDFCRMKPETTYDNLIADFGEAFAGDYTRDGRRAIGMIMASKE